MMSANATILLPKCEPEHYYIFLILLQDAAAFQLIQSIYIFLVMLITF